MEERSYGKVNLQTLHDFQGKADYNSHTELLEIPSENAAARALAMPEGPSAFSFPVLLIPDCCKRLWMSHSEPPLSNQAGVRGLAFARFFGKSEGDV